MQIDTYLYENKKWNKTFDSSLDSSQTLLILFSTFESSKIEEELSAIKASFPSSTLIGASSAGDIYDDEVIEEGISLAVVRFEKSRFKVVTHAVEHFEDSFESAQKMAKELYAPDLQAVFVLSDGLHVNGSQLAEGFSSVLPTSIPVTGGLAGDGARFEKTWIIARGMAVQKHVAAVGFYGEALRYGHGSKGGWDKLGLDRIITKSRGNILYELDNQPALDIYKKYLGEKASELPASGLLFPLEITDDRGERKVRTILGVDEEAKSIIFAGDMPEGCKATLMKANFEHIIDGAAKAAESVNLQGYHDEEILNIAISCVGRKLILKSKTEEELEALKESLPPKVKQIGFYSYGEISPVTSGKCDLHNQTMTITLIWESDDA